MSGPVDKIQNAALLDSLSATDLWEARSFLPQGIAQVLFTVLGSYMVFLHGFIKKAQKTPQDELDTARRRLWHTQEEDFDHESTYR